MGIAIHGGGIPQSIPEISFGYGNDFLNASLLNGFYWDSTAGFLYTLTPTEQFNVFLNVPQSTAKGFTNTTTPDSLYAIFDTLFPASLLTEQCTQLITESGVYLVV